MIKVKKRARIGAGVEEIYRDVAEKALRNIHTQIRTSPSSMGAQILRSKQGDIARLASIVQDNSGPGKGLDLEMTRIRGIDFAAIHVVRVHDKEWFCAETEGLKIQTVKGVGRNSTYKHSAIRVEDERDCGDYKVWFPVYALATPQVKQIHFVPNDDIFTRNRHYHQRASDHKTEGMANPHPTDMDAASCWGGFAEPMASVMESADLADLLRMLRMFVGRRNPRSILVSHPSTEKRDE